MLSVLIPVVLATACRVHPLPALPTESARSVLRVNPVSERQRLLPTDILLTADRLTHYLAVKRALQTYWSDLAHSAVLDAAQQSGHQVMLHFTKDSLAISVYDYPALARQDTALAALFTRNQFAPAQFEPVQVAVYHALGTIAATEAWHTPLPAESSVLGRNVALVRQYGEQLARMGFRVQFPFVLTPDLVTRYIAVRRALRDFWSATARAPLKGLADSTILYPVVVALGRQEWTEVASVYDYPRLVAKDTTLAAIFTRAHVDPAQFEQLQVAVYQALIEVVAQDFGWQYAYPATATTVGKNMAVVAKYKSDLKAIGVIPYVDHPIKLRRRGFILDQGPTPFGWEAYFNNWEL